MAIDTPAKIAVLGAGPIGLEAALYARFLGYDVVIFEQGEVAQHVRPWGHVRMFAPFAQCRSPLGLAAIEAQDENYIPPADDELLTGSEWADRYLLPLSQTDLLSDHLRTNTTVLSVGKEELHKGDLPGHEDRGDWSFRILVRDAAGTERVELADAVLDCTGIFGQANWLGEGGLPALGEQALRKRIEYRLPDILGVDRDHYAGKHTLLIGAGHSAATNAVALATLMEEAPGTLLTWITRREGPAEATGPIQELASDPLPARRELIRAANSLTQGGPAVPVGHESPIDVNPQRTSDGEHRTTYWPATAVHRIATTRSGGFEVELAGRHTGTLHVDEIIANVGFRPNTSLFAELQIRECSATQGFLDASAVGPERLVQPEPNYYILGAKSIGRQTGFQFADGLAQIRDVFTIIGDRRTLDLYANVKLPK
jgi:hypothetical protein